MEHPNAELLRRAWAAYNRGDIEVFASCLTDDWREYGPEGEAGDFATLEDERPTMEAHRSAFPTSTLSSSRSLPTMQWSRASALSPQRTPGDTSTSSQPGGGSSCTR
jgi:hypothetical protein